MARTARNDLKSTYFHVISQGIEKRYIFEKENYKKKYLKLLYEQSEKLNVKIIAYCIMDNHVHLLINIDRIESMSKFMHKVNCMYAQYYNFMEDKRKGYVFRDRFISEPICNEEYLVNCIIYIHNNPVKAKIVECAKQYRYSSYNTFFNKRGEFNFLDINKIVNGLKLEDYIFKDIDNSTEEIFKFIVKKYEQEYNMDFEEIQKYRNRYILYKLIKELKENYKIPYKEIVNRTNLSLSTISRVIKKNDLFLPRP